MKVQVIQLESYDDVISIRDRMGFIDTERVLLVWPPKGRIVKRKLDLVLIQREATRRGAKLALVLILVPSAEITLTPAQAQISTTVKITADPKIAKVNVESSRIPASIVEIDIQSQASIPTTGSSDVPNTLASGIVLFTNQTG